MDLNEQNYYRKARIRTGSLLIVLVLLFFFTVAAAVVLGAAPIPLKSVALTLLSTFTGHEGLLQEAGITDVQRDIILRLRLPRIMLAAVVGASLSLAGAVFQALFRNPMADPYVLGVSSGAALGAASAILLSNNLFFAVFSAVPLFAFVGGVLTIALVYSMSRIGKVVPVMTLLLA